jgi:hypothetical protein
MTSRVRRIWCLAAIALLAALGLLLLGLGDPQALDDPLGFCLIVLVIWDAVWRNVDHRNLVRVGAVLACSPVSHVIGLAGNDCAGVWHQ